MDKNDKRAILKLALKSIKEFDGYNVPVVEYLDECQEALEMVGPSNEHIFVKFLKTKLRGEARVSLQFERIQNYHDYKKHLLINYLSETSGHTMITEVAKDFQKSDETVLDFVLRLKKCKRHLSYSLFVEPNPLLTEDRLDEYFTNCLARGLEPLLVPEFYKIIKIDKIPVNFHDACLIAIMIGNGHSTDTFSHLFHKKSEMEESFSVFTENESDLGSNKSLTEFEISKTKPIKFIETDKEIIADKSCKILKSSNIIEPRKENKPVRLILVPNNSNELKQITGKTLNDKIKGHKNSKSAERVKIIRNKLKLKNFQPYFKASSHGDVPLNKTNSSANHYRFINLKTCVRLLKHVVQNCLKHFSNSSLNPILSLMPDGG